MSLVREVEGSRWDSSPAGVRASERKSVGARARRKACGLWRSAFAGVGVAILLLGVATGATWQMKQRDIHHTGRADYEVPPERLDNSFFDVFLWQTPAPNSPDEGCFGGTSMSFFDGAGPDGADIVVGGYHWPKGVQGMDRHTGARFWSGNPEGGETIAQITPAFSNDGSTIYVVNDATEDGQYPQGHPCMAFATPDGPSVFHHNGDNPDPAHMSMQSPLIAPDGRIFLHGYFAEPYAGADDGQAITEVWGAQTSTWCYQSDPSLYDDEGLLRVVVGTYLGTVNCYDGSDGAELWSVVIDDRIDSPVTIDPENGNIYAASGAEHIYVVGLDKEGDPLWSSASPMVYEHVPGTNEPQMAQSAGCLSHDGATYYFQTNSQQGEGALYAIDTSDGSVKWIYPTGSLGWDMVSSCPIVTPNGVVIVGNNLGDEYLAILDDGTQGMLLDAYQVTPSPAEQGHANASATLSPEGDLYLPLRTVWMASNGNGDVPTYATANLFSAFDLRPDAVAILPGPPWQAAYAQNHAVSISWQPLPNAEGVLDHYAIYRDTLPFTTVEGMTPIATVDDETLEYLDETAENGTSYYYAVTSVTTEAAEFELVHAIGPRTPFDETDLQVVTISRTPRYPRYAPTYTDHEITEPNGFGPYYFSAATGLEGGQDENTQRWPALNDPVTYTATVRNRGSNAWSGTLAGTWSVDGVIMAVQPQALALAPNETAAYAFVRPWDGASHEIRFTFTLADARLENNTLAIDTKSVAFLTFVDRTYVENFREETPGFAQATTDDCLDWLNAHMARFNAMFAAAGCAKRVHYDVLEVIPDHAGDPVVQNIDFAVFPFRFHANESSLRVISGWYASEDDIDYGLLHECAHQLGLIDIYQNDLSPEQNLVNGEGYTSAACLMNACSHFLSEHSANAMTHWIDSAHGYFGQYLYCLPQFVKLHLTGLDDAPLAGATVTIYQKAERPGLGSVITDQIKAQGVTDANGEWALPNVPVDPELVPPTYAGDELHDNPFGYIAVVGSNALMLIKVEQNGFVDYAWLDLLDVNNAYWAGQTGTAIFERRMALGGTVQHVPPEELTELNASSWEVWAEGGATVTATDDLDRRVVGQGSVRLTTDGGGDTYLRYPGDRLAVWNLSNRLAIHFWCYAENENIGFQNWSPWIRLHGPNGYIQFHANEEYLNGAIGQWVEFTIPMEGDEWWARSEVGSVSLADIRDIEIHADTWGYGFSLWVDGLNFVIDPAAAGDAERPLTLALSGVAPNPFTRTTEVRYALPSSGPVELVVFDVGGRRIRTLQSGVAEAGVHRLVWNGRDDYDRPAGAGVYFARLKAMGKEIQRKMVMRP